MKLVRIILFSAGLFISLVGVAALLPRFEGLFVNAFARNGFITDEGRLFLRWMGWISAVAGMLVVAISIRYEGFKRFVGLLGKKIENTGSVRWMVSVCVLAAVLRAAWVLYVPSLPVSDFAWYDDRAWEMARGLGFGHPHPTAYRSVGYPVFLAAIYLPAGHSILAAKLGQVLITSLFPLVIFGLVKTTGNLAAAKLSALAIAVYPPYIFSTSLLASENIYSPVLWLSLLIIYNGWREKKRGLYLWGGLVLGLAVAIRSQGILLPPLLLAAGLVAGADTPKRLVSAFLIVIVSSLAVNLPWGIRNYLVFGKFKPFTTNGGMVLYYNSASGSVVEGRALDGVWLEQGYNEAERDSKFFRLALREIAADPMLPIRRAPSKFARYFGPSELWLAQYNLRETSRDLRFESLVYNFVNYLSSSGYVILFLLFLAGLVGGSVKNPLRGYMVMVIVYSLLLVAIFHGAPRFRHHLIPAYAVFAAAFAADKLKKLR